MTTTTESRNLTDRDNPNSPELAKYQHVSSYVSDWRNLTGYYWGWIPNQYADQASADSAYELIKNDESVTHAMDLLALWSAAEYPQIYCYNAQLKQITEKALSYIERFTHARKSLLQGAVLFGLGLQKKEWKKVRFPEYPGLVWDVCYQLNEYDRRNLRIERDANDRMKNYWTAYSREHDSFVVVKDRKESPNYEGPTMQDFVFSWYEFEEMNPYFRGLGEVLYRLVYMRSKVIQYYAELCEKWGSPIVTALVDTMRGAFNASGAGDGFTNINKRVDDLLEQWEKMRARNTFVLHRGGDDVRIQEFGNSGNNILSDFLEYTDRKIHQLLIKAELSTQVGSGVGSYAMSQIHRGTTQAAVMYLRGNIEEDYKRDLVFDFLWRNRGNLAALGIPMPDVSQVGIKFKTKAEELREELVEQSTSDAEVQKAANSM